MKITHLLFASLSLLIMAIPASAASVTYEGLSAQQVGQLLGGYSVNQNGIYKNENGIDIRDLPDVETPVFGDVEVLDKPATHNSGNSPTYVNGNEPGFWNERCQTFAYVNADCTVLTMNPGGGGWPATYKTVNQQVGTELVDGPDVPVEICTHNEADIDFNWQTGFEVTITSTATDGAC